MSLSIIEEQNGDKRILRLEGRLDAQTCFSLEQEINVLFANQHRKVLLDLTRVEELTRDGLQMLFLETKKFQEAKGILGLSNPPDDLIKDIEKAGFDRVLLIYRNEETALKAMG
jgi:anti-anti-sigma factor